MKIERVDDNTIKCFISFEEMQQYNVEYTDFLTRTDKAQELMHEIIKQAHDEVGYQPPKFAFEMQIMMVPDQGMVLTFSEKEPFDIHDKGKVNAFLEHLKDFVGKLTDYSDKLGGNTAMDEFIKSTLSGAGLFGNAGASGATATAPGANGAAKADGDKAASKDATAEAGKNSKRNPEKLPEITEAVFAFANLSQVMSFADALPANIRITSELYKMDGDYYMHITKGNASYDRYSKVCVVALEFAELYRADKGCDEMLKEHGELLIAEKAHKKLRK